MKLPRNWQISATTKIHFQGDKSESSCRQSFYRKWLQVLEKFAKSQLGQSQLTGNDEAGQVDTFLYKRPIATAGASYLLKGSLNNRPSLAPTPYTESKSEDTLTSLNNELPSATTQYPIVPGRVLNGGVAVAGLVSTSNMVVNSRQSAPKPEMDKMQPFTVKNINIRNDGSLEMSVETYNSRLNRRKGTQPTARDLMQNTIKQSLSNNNLSRSRSQILIDVMSQTRVNNKRILYLYSPQILEKWIEMILSFHGLVPEKSQWV